MVATPDKASAFAFACPVGRGTALSGWVLVVDDDAADRMALFRLLERLGHHATVSESGTKAMELLHDEPFDLVLLNLRPDGYAVLEALKRDPELRAIPVIAISDGVVAGDAGRSVEFDAEDYLTKPVDVVLLRLKVDACLAQKRLRDAQRRSNQ